jgi:putative ABC transport system permease protein
VLKLLGARTSRLMGLVFQQAWLLGVLAYLIAFLIGELLYPSFPRRVVLTEQIRWGSPIAILLLNTLASGLGVWHASRVDAGRVLEG